MEKERKRLPRSEAVHRRKVLAESRRQPPPPNLLEQQIRSSQKAHARLQQIEEILGTNEDITAEEKVILQIEEIWLRFRLGLLNQADRQSQLQELLNNLKEENFDVFNWLTNEGESNGSCPLAEIRDRVMPPTKIGGYHTKRLY